MSIMQRMTLIGLYNYERTFNRDLFSSLSLPEGYNKSTFVNSLLLEHGEKCVMYTDPEFFKCAIGFWSNKWALELARIYEALTAEYNPIYNYDRFEQIQDKEKIQRDGKTVLDRDQSDSPKYNDDVTNDYDIVTEQNVDGTVEHQISADNSSTYQPESQDITDSGKTTQSNDGTIKRHIEGKTQDLKEDATTTIDDDTQREYEHGAHIFGNIGVTTSSAMVNEVILQRTTKNLYDIVTRLFANELLIGIY